MAGEYFRGQIDRPHMVPKLEMQLKSIEETRQTYYIVWAVSYESAMESGDHFQMRRRNLAPSECRFSPPNFGRFLSLTAGPYDISNI